jgi:hypothetical protein
MGKQKLTIMTTPTTDELPSILTVPLQPGVFQQVTYCRPSVGNGIEIIDETEVMAMRRLTMHGQTAIPAHRHLKKEKVYIMDQDPQRGSLTVFRILDGLWQPYLFQRRGQRLVIRPGTPHCVYCHCNGQHDYKPSLLVITSSQAGSDIEWESATDDLLRNLHLSKK